MEIIPGVFGIDFQGRVWAYLIRQGKRFTLVDAGIAGQVDVIAAAASDAGGSLTDIEHIVLTHCHLDHSRHRGRASGDHERAHLRPRSGRVGHP